MTQAEELWPMKSSESSKLLISVGASTETFLFRPILKISSLAPKG